MSKTLQLFDAAMLEFENIKRIVDTDRYQKLFDSLNKKCKELGVFRLLEAESTNNTIKKLSLAINSKHTVSSDVSALSRLETVIRFIMEYLQALADMETNLKEMIKATELKGACLSEIGLLRLRNLKRLAEANLINTPYDSNILNEDVYKSIVGWGGYPHIMYRSYQELINSYNKVISYIDVIDYKDSQQKLQKQTIEDIKKGSLV